MHGALSEVGGPLLGAHSTGADVREAGGCRATASTPAFAPQKWTTAWHPGARDASLSTHLQSFDSPIAMEEEWPSLETPA